MKTLFGGILLLLIGASFYTMMTATERNSAVPAITWRTDANPQREDQVMLFREWLVKNGYVQKDKNANAVLYTEAEESNRRCMIKPEDPHRVKAGVPKPAGDIFLETADNQSTMIQAVSGMAGDIFDTPDVIGFQQMGVAVPLTDDARKNGYDVSQTYPGLAGRLVGSDGEQYGYPCNGNSSNYWINKGTLKRFGFDGLPENWTPEEFEAIGKACAEKANKGLATRKYFFTQSLDGGGGATLLITIARSRGRDLFNETLTRCTADQEIFRKLLKKFYQWTYVDRFLPTSADIASMNTEAGYGGADFSNFIAGRYAMIMTGRYCLVRFREIQKERNLLLEKAGEEPDYRLEFDFRLLPQYEFKNTCIRARSAMLYRASRQPELGKLFL